MTSYNFIQLSEHVVLSKKIRKFVVSSTVPLQMDANIRTSFYSIHVLNKLYLAAIRGNSRE